MSAQKINLLPNKDFDKTILGKFLRFALTYGRYIIISTEIIVLCAFIFRFSLDRTITDLNEEIEQKSAIVEANLGFEDRFRNLQTRTEHIGNLFGEQTTPIDILTHLEQITPQGIHFSSFLLSEEDLTITVAATTTNSLSLFLNSMQKSPFFDTVAVTTVSKKTTQSGETSVKIDATLKKPDSQTIN